MNPDLTAVLADPQRVAELPPEAIPALLGELERLKATLWARMVGLSNGHADTSAEPDQLLTIGDVAKLLEVPKGYAYELARRGEIPTVRFGRYVRVSRSVLQAWQMKHEKKGPLTRTRTRRYVN